MIEQILAHSIVFSIFKMKYEDFFVIKKVFYIDRIHNMMDRLSNPSKLKAYELSEELKSILSPLFVTHMDNILSGNFSETMMKDWGNDDKELLNWREQTSQTAFEKTNPTSDEILEQEYFDNGVLMVAFIKAGVELAYETMVEAGIKEESAYYESLHELPLIANLVSDLP